MNASISGAEVGLSGEVGVACSMAAAGLKGCWAVVRHWVLYRRNRHGAQSGVNLQSVAGGRVPAIERNAI